MPRKKATAPAAETEAKKAEEVKAEETVKAATAKKTTARKTAAKKTAPKAEEVKAVETVEEAPVVAEAAPVQEAPVAPTAEVFIEFGGAQVPVSEIVRNAQNVVGADKDIKVYVQPENSKAYIAYDDQSVEMDVYFVQ